MNSKYIFIDLDGTLIDHETHEIPSSAIIALQKLKENGHHVFIATGRPPCLFYGIDKKLGIDSYIGANGRIVVYQGITIYKDPLQKEDVEEFTIKMEELGFDVGYETSDDYYVQSKRTENVQKFNDVFHLDQPPILRDKYKGDDVYQIALYIEQKDLDKAKKAFPKFYYSVSNPYGIDVVDKEGLKDIGIKALVNHLGISIDDCIAVGDGYNDISMIEYVGFGIAMGNAYEEVKKAADYITDDISNNGLYNAFKYLNLI